jgi:predicted O-methyltransferase YrrM
VSDKESNWKFSEDFVLEDEHLVAARQHSHELGIEPVSPGVGAQAALLAGASRATSIIEVGTGAGVSGLCLLSGAPRAVLTSIDTEPDHQHTARTSFTDAGIPANRMRLITGRARDVLPRMNESSYDIVFIDADPASVIEYVEHGLRLARVGGTVLVPHALWRGRVANPAARDDVSVAFRTLLQEVARSKAVTSALSPVGDGLLQLVKRGR